VGGVGRICNCVHNALDEHSHAWGAPAFLCPRVRTDTLALGVRVMLTFAVRAMVVPLLLIAPGATAKQAAAPPKCQAQQLLCDLLPDSGKDRRVIAIEQIAAREDQHYIAPLIDLLRFIKDAQEYTQAIITLNRLTGKDWSVSADPVDDLIV